MGSDVNQRGFAAGFGSSRLRELLFDHLIAVLAVLVALTVAGLFWYLSRLQEQVVLALAEQGARLQVEALDELRGLYTEAVVDKLRAQGIEVTHDYLKSPTAIPLPATLTIELGERIAKRGSGMSVRLYSAYPFPWRQDGGPRDAFEREALDALTRNPAKPFVRFEPYRGEASIRFAVADRMRAACVGCHNTHPASPKTDWKLGDVRGVLEVSRPMSSVALAARDQQWKAFGAAMLLALLGLGGLSLVFGRLRQLARALRVEVDERRRAATELGATAARLSAMDAASPLGSFVTDAQGLCQQVNPSYQRITGYGSEAMAGLAWSKLIHPDDLDMVLARWRDAAASGQVFAAECRLWRSDGTLAWVSWKAAAMHRYGELLGYVGTLEDIGERKQVERMKNEFVSTVSHELRTPLTSIMGALGLLAGGVGGTLSEQAGAMVEIARKNSERLVRLINDMLDIEKIESGNMPFDLQPLALQALVEQAVATNSAYAAQLGVSYVIAAALPGARARVDADRLMQLMTNLMANAAKFSPRGAEVELRLTRVADRLRFSVTDHGPGIPEAFRDKVFGKFSQADSSDTRQKGGTGLGLSISKAIVEAMGGRIGFDSREGEGSCFYFELPEWQAAAPGVPGPGDAPKVLVCEDDPDIAKLLCMMLGRAGYATWPAHDAASARALLAQHHFTAMTLDLRLPDIDGRAFLHELRSASATRELCIVVVSADVRRAPRADEGEGLGVVDWLAKPIDEARLLDAMRRRGPARGNGKARVLHVEDDADLRQVVASLCADVATFDAAATYQEAAAQLAAHAYDLVILDITLPDRSGWDLLPVIESKRPAPPVLVFSGAELSAAESGRVAAVLVKSHVSNPELLATIHTLSSQSR